MTNEELVYLYQNGDRKALAELTEKNKGIVNKLANKFYTERTSSIDKEDLEQEGYIGLILAADKYDLNNPAKAKFITYAIHWIYSKMNRFIRTKNTNEETSLNTPIGEELEGERMDFIEYIDSGYENIEEKLYLQKLREDLEELMNKNLTLRQREVLKFYYGWDIKPITFREIGEIFSVSKQCARQIEAMAIRNMRHTTWAQNMAKELYIEKVSKSDYSIQGAIDKISFVQRYFLEVL